MSVFIHADSRWRNRNLYPSPSNFCIDLETVCNWRTEDRSVLASKRQDKPQLVDMNHVIKLHHVTIPQINLTNASTFGMGFTPTFLDFYPYIYVALQSTTKYKDMKLLNTGEGMPVNTTLDVSGTLQRVSLKDAIFVATFDKVQSGATTSWLHYKCGISQCYRIDTKDSLHIRAFTHDGLDLPIIDTAPPLPCNPFSQTSFLFESTPYFRSSDFDNHFVNQKYVHSN